jgi:hypothetical protein
MANMDSLFLEFCICICSVLYFLYFFVVGYLDHDFLDGFRPSYTLDRHSMVFFKYICSFCKVDEVQKAKFGTHEVSKSAVQGARSPHRFSVAAMASEYPPTCNGR